MNKDKKKLKYKYKWGDKVMVVKIVDEVADYDFLIGSVGLVVKTQELSLKHKIAPCYTVLLKSGHEKRFFEVELIPYTKASAALYKDKNNDS